MKLESFKEFKIETLNYQKISGGLAEAGGKWIATKKDPYTDSNGCTVNTTDSFYDANGNGTYDAGESGTVCQSVDCGV